MVVTAVIHVLCDTRVSLGTTIVNGMLAWAALLGGFTAFGSGSLAAISILVPVQPDARANAINLGLAWGFLGGMAAGVLTLIVFIARIVT